MELLEVVSVLISLVSLYPGTGGQHCTPSTDVLGLYFTQSKCCINKTCVVVRWQGSAVLFLQAALESLSLYFFSIFFSLLFMGAGKHSEISLDKPQQLEDTGFSMEWRNFIRGAIVPLCSQHFGNCSLD